MLAEPHRGTVDARGGTHGNNATLGASTPASVTLNVLRKDVMMSDDEMMKAMEAAWEAANDDDKLNEYVSLMMLIKKMEREAKDESVGN